MRSPRSPRATASASLRCSTGPAPRTPLAASAGVRGMPARSWYCRPAIPATSTRCGQTSTRPSISATSPNGSSRRRAGSSRGGAAPRPHPGQKRAAGAGADRVPVRRGREEIGRPSIPEDAAAEDRCRSALHLRDQQDRTGGGAAPGHRRRTGCPLRQSLEAAAGFGRDAGSAGHDDPAGIPKTRPLSLGSGGIGISKQLHTFLQKADLVFGIGCSFTRSSSCDTDAKGQTHCPCHARPDRHRRTCQPSWARRCPGLTLDALLEEIKDRLHGKPRDRLGGVTRGVDSLEGRVDGAVDARLTPNTKPLSPYRVISEMLHTVDVKETIITHDAGSPRDQLSPFWVSEDAAQLYRLGQDDPGSATSSAPRDGRQIGGTGELCIKFGAMPRSASPAWVSRPRSGSACRSFRS